MADQLSLTRAPRSTVATNPSRMIRQQVPAFLNKLYSMVNDPETDDLIRWADEDDSFIVPNHERFGRELLPKFFKHGNFPSFVRQLNMYGFHKVPHLQQGVLHSDAENELWQFSNPHFQRGQPDLLTLIQRKKTTGAQKELTSDGNERAGASTSQPSRSRDQPIMDLTTVAGGLAAIKRHQATISAELKEIQNSNAALWQEALAARERHQKHQDTINRILKFLAGVFGSNGGGTPGRQSPRSATGHSEDDGNETSMVLRKRKRPRLMIEEGYSKSPQARLQEADDEDWSAEDVLEPLDTNSKPDEMLSPVVESPWPPAATLESIATTPSADTPRPIQSPTSLTKRTPSTPFSNISPQISKSTGSASTADPATPSTRQVNNLLQASNSYPSPYLDTSDPAMLQQFLSSPTSLSRMFSLMQQPSMTTLPSLSDQDMATITGSSIPANNSTSVTSPKGSSVFQTLNDAQNGQMIAAGSNSMGYLQGSLNGLPNSTNLDFSTPLTRPLSPKSALALLDSTIVENPSTEVASSNGADGFINALGGQAQQIQKTYKDAAAIDAEVDSIQNSIDTLFSDMGIDPAAFSDLQSNPQTSVDQSLDQDSANMDLDTFFFGQPGTSTTYDPTTLTSDPLFSNGSSIQSYNADSFNPFDMNGYQPTDTTAAEAPTLHPPASLDEVGTSSTASSPVLSTIDDPHFDTSKISNAATIDKEIGSGKETKKGTKRKSETMDVDKVPSKPTRSTRKKV